MVVIVTHKSESVIYNGNIYKKDDTFEVDEVIGKSLIDRGYVAPVGEKEEADDLEAMSYSDLKKRAAEIGVSASGKKEELIDRIRAAMSNTQEEQEEADDLDDTEEPSDEMPNTSMPE